MSTAAGGLAEFDHLAIAAGDLGAGVAKVEARLGVAMAPGGQHAAMATHNRLLALGPGEYMEVIAIDPGAPGPGRARWFALDSFDGPPRPRAWILRCPDLEAALAVAPAGAGRPLDFARGDLRWRMAVPDDGMLPFDGLFPALIQWQAGRHPAGVLPASGLSLARLTLTHPRGAALAAALAALTDDPRIEVRTGPAPAMAAVLEGPAGAVVLA